MATGHHGESSGAESDPGTGTSGKLIGLMYPHALIILNLAMISVAIPAIRDSFALHPDQAAWIVSTYTLPFAVSMPLYGRLGEGLGKRRLYFVGILIFILGTLINFLAPNLWVLLVGRAIQGFGAGGVVPLSIALIAELFPAVERGNALGTWNTSGPLMGIAGTLLGGFLIQGLGWHGIFLPVLLFGLVAPWIFHSQVPAAKEKLCLRLVGVFDWLGGLLLAGSVLSLLLFVTSQPLTGVPNLTDWRLLTLAVLLLVGLVFWERQREYPFIDLQIFTQRGFLPASLSACARMLTMSCYSFILPLLLTDVFLLSAPAIGANLMLHAGAVLLTMRWGGRLADLRGSWIPVAGGFALQAVTLGLLAVLTPLRILPVIQVGVALNGLGAGLTLAPLHRAALEHVPAGLVSPAAGVYSMLRFIGTIFGPPLMGTILRMISGAGPATASSYATSFWFIAGMGLIGMLLGLALRPSRTTLEAPPSG